MLSELKDSDWMQFSKLLNNLSSKVGTGENWGWLVRRLVEDNLVRESNDGLQMVHISNVGLCFLQSPWTLDYVYDGLMVG